MSTVTSIEWTEQTWNPVSGCTEVSEGCDNCYARKIAERFRGSKAFPDGFAVTLHPDRLDQPLRRRKPTTYFVNSMSDLFHDDVPDEFIARVFAVMALTPQHTYQVLTKRPGRMASLLSRDEFIERVQCEVDERQDSAAGGDEIEELDVGPWPLSNVWLGVSVENQKWADIRIPKLLETPAAVRFLSCEPLLGSIDLRAAMPECRECPRGTHLNLRGHCPANSIDRPVANGIDWVIVGGESGTAARAMHPDWARDLVQQCDSAGVACFVKQMGRTFGKDHHNPETWPEDLRVREMPNA